MRSRGFTLIEMLVATGVFLIGFTAAYTMFLAGTKARVQADGILRMSLAASSIVEEIRLEAGREKAGTSRTVPAATTCPPYPPSDYVGCGFAAIGTEPVAANPAPSLADPMYRYDLQPGIWYRVLKCVDEKGDADTLDSALATTLQLDLLLIWNPLPDPTMTMQDLITRQRIDKLPDYIAIPAGPNHDPQCIDFLVNHLAKRGFALHEHVVVVRHASWDK